ncbi:MAG TPA: hypothetical protein VHY77_02790 [Acidimicrobiales bacterium]|nr:hypothetical protein [Acidimicrobiales bacterium]
MESGPTDEEWSAGMAALSAEDARRQRLDRIWAMLSEHLLNVGVQPVRQSLEDWQDETDSYGPFGYGHPRWHSAEEALGVCSVWFCPERIAETTGWLNEFDLEEYVVAIEVQLDYDIAHHEMNEQDAAKWFRQFILANAPGSWKLMSDVRERWLTQR